MNESEARLFHVRRSWNVKIDKNVFSTIILFRPETLTKIRLRFNDMVKRFEESAIMANHIDSRISILINKCLSR